MRNPWLDISAADYVGHMSSAKVGQLSVLSQLLRESLERFRPRDVLLPGCSTGNGLSHVDPAVTRRVLGVDINPEYLARIRDQFPRPDFELQLDCADLMTYAFPADAFDLVHCALLLEYLDWPRLLPRFAKTLRVNGRLSIVLQRPSDASPAVTVTTYSSLRRLERLIQLVEPSALIPRAIANGLELESQRVEPLPSGKAFDVLLFKKATTRECDHD